MIAQKNPAAVGALLKKHQEACKEHTATEKPNGLPQHGSARKSETKHPVHAGSCSQPNQ